jgi:hypothetical protein
MHRLAHAAGVRRRGRDRHGHGHEHTRKQQDQQESGGQAMHKQIRQTDEPHTHSDDEKKDMLARCVAQVSGRVERRFKARSRSLDFVRLRLTR